MNTITALDVLEPCKLILTLPEQAFNLPWMSNFLKYSALGGHTPKQVVRRNGALRPGLVSIELASVAWEWETEHLDTHDDSGDIQPIELLKDLVLDTGDIAQVERLHSRIASQLRALGIPFDSVFTDGQRGEVLSHHGRLNPKDSSAYSQPIDSYPSPDPSDTLALMETCSTLIEFQECQAFMKNQYAPIPDLLSDLSSFEQQLAAPGWCSFLEASAGFILWASTRFTLVKSRALTWSPDAPAWAQTRYNQENPLERFDRLGLPFESSRLREILTISLAQHEPDIKLIGVTLQAYCSGAVHVMKTRRQRKTPKVSLEVAAQIGLCLEKMPHLITYLHTPNAAFLFNSELDIPTQEDLDAQPKGFDMLPTPKEIAFAETHWLRAQSLLANRCALNEPTRVKRL